MQKPNDYDNTQAQGEYVPVQLGGHMMIIKQVEEAVSKAGNPMIIVYFDFAPEDVQAGYFGKQFRDDIRPDKKWPYQGRQYILTEDAEGKCNKSFKTFTTCVEHSNTGFTTQWSDNFGEQFKNKKIGGVFGAQTDYYNGKKRNKQVLRWFISADKVAEATIPDPIETQAYKNYMSGYAANATPTGNGFMSIPDGVDEEVPFN